MTKRYFYTDPLEVVYMYNEFGMSFDEPLAFGFFDGEFRISAMKNAIDLHSKYKYYIRADSERLLEPQSGDVIDFHPDDVVYTALTTKEYADIGVLYGKNHKFIEIECICDFSDRKEFEWFVDNYKIIQRNGKAFFTPESDEV